jgi:hypothetical protein
VFDYIDHLIDTRIESLYAEIDIKVLELMDTIENLTNQNTEDETSSPKAKRRKIGKTEKVFKIKNTEIDLNKIGFVLPQFINEKLNEDDWERLLYYLCNSLKV